MAVQNAFGQGWVGSCVYGRVCMRGCGGAGYNSAGGSACGSPAPWLPSSFYGHITACHAPGNIRLRGLGREKQTSLTPVFGPLLLVGEIGLVPASTGEDKPLLPVPPVLAIWQHWEVRHAAAGWVPVCHLLIRTHGEALGRHTGPHSIHQGRQPRTLLLPGVMLSRHVLKGKSKAMTSVSGKRHPDAKR